MGAVVGICAEEVFPDIPVTATFAVLSALESQHGLAYTTLRVAIREILQIHVDLVADPPVTDSTNLFAQSSSSSLVAQRIPVVTQYYEQGVTRMRR